MAQITINEISQSYSYNVGTNSFATVALPITACWGPAYQDPKTLGVDKETVLENTSWTRFPSTQEGLEAFVAAYRGPASNYRLAKDYSYQMAMTLLTAGYDVLVCRVSPGTNAQKSFETNEGTLNISAKYPGTFGNNLRVVLRQYNSTLYKYPYWSLVTYIVDASGIQTAVENITFVFNIEHSNDSILHIDEVESDFLSFKFVAKSEETEIEETTFDGMLTGGTDKVADGEVSAMIDDAVAQARVRYQDAGSADSSYLTALEGLKTSLGATNDVATASSIRYMEWVYTAAYTVFDLLKDKLTYNHQRVISPGWDDQNITAISDEVVTRLDHLSPLHVKLLDCGYNCRCATAFIDIPKCLPRSGVYNEEEGQLGYAQLLSRYVPDNTLYDVNIGLYSTHSALFAPWGQYTYTGTSKMQTASPSFLALMIQRAMIKNQSVQYEWIMPTNRAHTLNIGKLDYNVPKKLLDEWQNLEGTGVNILAKIPDLGTTLWGNSTLYEIPPATYQALQNLSTRFLVNAIEDIVYKCGISITFQYNNDQAYNSFYAGVTPTLDAMKNAGAIEDYLVKMSADISGTDRVNANTVLGKIYITVNGIINDIKIDLIALPPSVDLSQFNQ